MTPAVQEDLRRFATALLERRGALVDWPSQADEGLAVLPDSLVRLLPTHDTAVPLTTVPGRQGLCVHLATDFLELAGRMLEEESRIGTFRLGEMYLKRGPVDEAIRRTFHWLNAKVTVREPRPQAVAYHTWWFRAAIASEDRWETRLMVSLNAASGLEVAMPDPFRLLELEPAQDRAPDPALTYDRAVAVAKARVLELGRAFLERMDSRLLRDRKRLRDYYHALLREADHQRTRPGVPVDPERVEAKKRAVQLELRRKLSELDERYAIQVTLAPLVLVQTHLAVLAVDLDVLRKRSARIHTIFWNPLLKQFEPMACSRCGAGAFSLAFTDEEVEPICAACSTRPARSNE